MGTIRRLESIIAAVLLTGAAFLGGAPSAGAQETELETPQLNSKVLTALKQDVLPAYFRGDQLRLIEALNALLPKLSEIELNSFNELLAVNSAPSVERMLIDSRLILVLRGATEGVSPPGRHELLVVIPEIKRQIDETASEAAANPAMKIELPTPSDFAEYERLFWRVHVLEQRLDNAKRLAEYGYGLQARSRRLARRASKEQQEILKTDFAEDVDRLDALSQELQERKVELRIQRLQLAYRTLRTTQDLREKLDAAYVASLDGRLLTSFFDVHDKRRSEGLELTLRRPQLRDESLSAEIRQLAKDAIAAAGDLAEKGNLLYTGIHWWLRGRYGRGSEGGGLLKPKLAVRSPELMFPLYMPRQLYNPNKEQGVSIQAPIDRRHHYVWAFEPRRILRQQFNSSTSTSIDTDTSKTTLSYFY